VSFPHQRGENGRNPEGRNAVGEQQVEHAVIQGCFGEEMKRTAHAAAVADREEEHVSGVPHGIVFNVDAIGPVLGERLQKCPNVNGRPLQVLNPLTFRVHERFETEANRIVKQPIQSAALVLDLVSSQVHPPFNPGGDTLHARIQFPGPAERVREIISGSPGNKGQTMMFQVQSLDAFVDGSIPPHYDDGVECMTALADQLCPVPASLGENQICVQPMTAKCIDHDGGIAPMPASRRRVHDQ